MYEDRIIYIIWKIKEFIVLNKFFNNINFFIVNMVFMVLLVVDVGVYFD